MRVFDWLWILSKIWTSDRGVVHFNRTGRNELEMVLNGHETLTTMTLDEALAWAFDKRAQS